MPGLIDLEQSFGKTAQDAFGQLGQQEQARNRERSLAKLGEKNQRTSMALQGAAVGAQIGMAGGPVGAGAGFFIGALAGLAGSKIF